MKTYISRKTEEVELCTLKPGDVFIPSEYENDDYIFMVANTCSADGVCLDFDEGNIIGICLNDGEVIAFGGGAFGYVVEGEFKGEY